jgi:hypothetical protein
MKTSADGGFSAGLLSALVFIAGVTTVGEQASATLSGRVLDGRTGTGVTDARVSLLETSSSAPPWSVPADSEGRFRFSPVAAGRYELTVEARGYTGGALGKTLPGALTQLLDVRQGDQLTDLTLFVWKLGVITGRVWDDAGDPAVRVRVAAVLRTALSGFTQFDAGARSTVTDDAGKYRLVVPPGTYVVAVPWKTLAGSTSTGLPTVFHPSALSAAQATVVTLEAGDERAGVDVHLPQGVRALLGRVEGTGESTGSYTVRLLPLESRDASTEFDAREATTSSSGVFSFADVPMGQYLVHVVRFPGSTLRDGVARLNIVSLPPTRVLPSTPAQPTLWGEAAVTVTDAETNHVVVSLRTAPRVSGRVLFDGFNAAPSLAAPPSSFVIVAPASGRDLGNIPLAKLEADGRFQTVGLPPGPYFLSPWTRWWQGWTLRSIRAGGQEIAGRPLQVAGSDVPDVVITMADHSTGLAGTVRDSRGRQASLAAVCVVATDPTLRHRVPWGPSRMAWVRSAVDGTYRIDSLLPGEYVVAAAAHGSVDDLVPLASMQALANSGSRIQLAPGETRVMDLTIRGSGQGR